MGLICLIGLIAYAYTSAPRRFRPSRAYQVTHLDKVGDALAVALKPDVRPLKHRAGQFAFISFSGLGLWQPHPFTLSAAPQQDGSLRMTIGPLGDYTIRLMSRLQVGAEARVEGPFGDFGMARGPQVWVAAGIGITPFAAMAGSIGPKDGPVTLIYSVRSRSQAAHIEELEAIADGNDNFTLVLRETSDQGRLTPADVAEAAGNLKKAHVLYCGPSALREAIWSGLKRQGLSARRFHYERFEIRTGVGLETLFRWLLDRAGPMKSKVTPGS